MSRNVLDKLLAHSFENYQVLFNHLAFHNHNVHHLGALYFLGASDEKLEQVYKVLCDIVDPYDSSPHEITRANWRDSLGDKHFCKAYNDFFQQELTASGDDWRKKFLDLLLENKSQPMINGILCGLVHPLIHIGYAFELDSRIVAIEALTMTAVAYNELHEWMDTMQVPKSCSKSALEVLQDIHSDDRFPIFDGRFFDKVKLTLEKSIDLVLFYHDQWKTNKNNLEKTIEELFDLSVYIYGATHDPNQITFSFVLLHLMTGMHAIRMMYPHLNDQQLSERILSQFFFYIIIIYIAIGRPQINKILIDEYKIDDTKNNWNYVIERILNSNFAELMHLVKIVHSLKAAEVGYGFKNGLYLKTAIKLSTI